MAADTLVETNGQRQRGPARDGCLATPARELVEHRRNVEI